MSNIYTDPPQSRNEAIIKSTIDGTQYTDPPQSRMEDLLLELKETIEQGGGGTTVVANPEGEATDELEKLQVGSDIYGIPKDYEDLDNKPQINGETLEGNKTASELGLQAELDGAQTVSGNPITVADAEPMNAESVLVELEPKQDLHGYDAPWVGGSGKNKFEVTATTQTINGVTFTVNSDGTVIANGTATAEADFLMSASNIQGSYIVNGCPMGGSTSTYYLGIETSGSSWNNRDLGNGVTINDDTIIRTAIVIVGGYTANNLIFKPMIRLSTETDPTFAPYSNICPISGYSEVNVERVGKNLFDEANTSWIQGYIKGNDGVFTSGQTVYMCMKAFLPCNHLRGKKLTLNKRPGGYTPGFAFYSEQNEESYISGVINGNVEANTPMTVIVPENANYMRFTVPYQDVVYGIQLEIGETATTYEPYQGDTYTIDLDGTKYGGTLDVTNGVLTVDRTITDLGDITYQYSSGYQIFYAEVIDAKYSGDRSGFDCICSQYASVTDDWSLMDNGEVLIGSNTAGSGKPCINIKDTRYIDVTQFKTAVTGQELVYELSTPLTIQLTPTQIQMLENTNNISTDGTNITLKYQPNNVIGECKAYTDEEIDKVLPPLPTTDGTYHLSCEVSSGVGVLSWVSDS